MNPGEREFLLSLFSFKNKLSDNLKIKKLYEISNNVEKHYKICSIKKRNGKKRTIYMPDYYLKNIQRNILKDFLYDKKSSKYTTSYIKNKSIYDNAKEHINKKYIIKLDIKDFFNNLSFIDVYNIYDSYGINKNISILLTYLSTYNDFLPQGSPTSAYLSNLILRKFDYEIGEYCKENNISYTRYSDDMTFSMNTLNKEIINIVRKKLYKYGLELNNNKIKIVSNYFKQIVTGLVVNKKVQVDIKYRKKIRQELYYINKYGLKSHLNRINITNKKQYIDSLKGRILFVLNIDKDNKEFKEYLNIIKQLT